MTMDTVPGRYFRNGKRIDGSYPCFDCRYGSNDVCRNCCFARWNVEGIMAGFAPKEAYRRAHKNDIPQSPLMQKLEKPTGIDYGFPNNAVLPTIDQPFFPTASPSSIQSTLNKLLQIRKVL